MLLSKSGSETPLLVCTPGEPAGIGPDILLGCSASETEDLIVVADPDLIRIRAEQLGISRTISVWEPGQQPEPGALNVFHVPLNEPVIAGHLNPANAAYVLQTLEAAVSLCEAGTTKAIVTGPVNKAVINEAGIPFTGHTEWLEQRLNANKVVMMLATHGLRVALVTTHLPLRAVADAVTTLLLTEVISILAEDLRRYFGIDDPRIVVLGLNPHAGESGHMGREEIDIIEPVLAQFRDTGLRLTGPLPADTAFNPKVLDHCDAVLAMYHDQGLPVLKFKGFGESVNITLGLPLIRTSVDHGTGLDIAGTGRADSGSLKTAIQFARQMAAGAA
ncbi:MAG: 4-hydroxythreonine-4-phosphate dehydrogenase PdxA [Pseudomonadales bacterium]|nr:4-hydroxythreonine-4-phosphate dehydrogenase PdxA [Pseudomonadales bacterium]